MLDRLRRVTDLFVEGTEVFLGMGDDHKPVVIWVNKLNSFEVEESRRDGMVRRGQRVMELSKDDSPEFEHVRVTVSQWTDEELAERRVDQKSEDIYLDVVNELQGDEEWREKIAIMRRLPQLLNDEKAPSTDPRYAQIEELNGDYLKVIRERQEKKQQEALRDYVAQDRPDLEAEFYEAWRERVSLDVFMQERRVTEMYYSMRDCVAEMKGRDETTGKPRFDHSACNHTERLLQERKQVRDLPEYVLNLVIDAIDEITVGQRESGNSGAPASSSASSGQQSEEEDSTVSIPVETSPESRMT